jgi:transcriptional regulator of acetoin/glycerol metabolism
MMNSNHPSSRGVMNAYAQGAAYNTPEHSAIIESSQERSRGFGLISSHDPDYSGSSTRAVSALLEENHFLYQHAAPVMETLYEQIANTHSMVLLTTRTGTKGNFTIKVE